MKSYVFSLFAFLVFLTGCSLGYENDGHAVYFKTWDEGSGSHKYKLDADPKTFQRLKDHSYAKDDRTVFYEGEIIKGADAGTFESLDEWYAKDKNRGYYGGDAIEYSIGQAFKPINGHYSTDGRDIFYDTFSLHVCSAKGFKIVEKDRTDTWTTDGCYYYYNRFKIPSDDYKYLKIFKNSGGLSKDRHYVYINGHKLNYDVDGKKVVDTVDAASFEVTGFLECRDKWGCFNPYHGRKIWD